MRTLTHQFVLLLLILSGCAANNDADEVIFVTQNDTRFKIVNNEIDGPCPGPMVEGFHCLALHHNLEISVRGNTQLDESETSELLALSVAEKFCLDRGLKLSADAQDRAKYSDMVWSFRSVCI